MARWLFTAAAASGFLAVLLGAFGAHGLQGQLASLADGARRLDWWETAANYHLTHSLAVALSAFLYSRSPGRLATASGWLFLGGISLFSGSLYVMAVSGLRSLGMITPLGGSLLLAGWLTLCLGSHRASSSAFRR